MSELIERNRPAAEPSMKAVAEPREDVSKRDAECAAMVLELLSQVPIKATFGDVADVAKEAAKVRRWLAGFVN